VTVIAIKLVVFLLLAVGTVLILRALAAMEREEPKGWVGKGWLREERRRQWR